mgnify:CR=1 FL=1
MLARSVGTELGVALREGVYAGLSGPSYETPAEIRAFAKLGADAIGMSGLLVKSTLVMKENLEVMNERGVTIPVVLGGAALVEVIMWSGKADVLFTSYPPLRADSNYYLGVILFEMQTYSNQQAASVLSVLILVVVLVGNVLVSKITKGKITFGEVTIEDAGGSQAARVSLNEAAETATLDRREYIGASDVAAILGLSILASLLRPTPPGEAAPATKPPPCSIA